MLTGYVKSRYGERCRILLSEQGYSSVTAGRDTSAEQARNIALAYYIAAQNSMVDALILHRQVDHTGEEERFGLYTSWGGENAALPKQSWSTYKYANTTAADPYMKYAARQARALSGQKVTKSLKVKRMALQPIGDLNWKRNFTGGFAAFGALADFRADQGGFLLTHDFSRNPNVPWGMVRQGRINCRKRTKFGFGIQVSASQSGSANIYLRLWAGPSRYLDASATVPLRDAESAVCGCKELEIPREHHKSGVLYPAGRRRLDRGNLCPHFLHWNQKVKESYVPAGEAAVGETSMTVL